MPNDPEVMKDIMSKLINIFLNFEGEPSDLDKIRSYLHPEFRVNPVYDLDRKDMGVEDFLHTVLRVEGVARYSNIEQKMVVGKNTIVIILRVDVTRKSKITKGWRNWGYYTFQDNLVIEFARMGDSLQWVEANHFEVLKQIVDNARERGEDEQIRSYLQKLVQEGFIQET